MSSKNNVTGIKTKFRKNERGFRIFLDLVVCTPLIIGVAVWLWIGFEELGAIFIISLWSLIMLMAMLVLMPIIGYKNSLSTIRLSYDGIKYTELIYWSDIIDIQKIKHRIRGAQISFVTHFVILDILMTRKLYKSLLHFAPFEVTEKIKTLGTYS